MKSRFNESCKFIALAVVIMFWTLTSAAIGSLTTFVLTASLPAPTMRMGDDLVVVVITSNPTDHTVYAGEGLGGGLAVELLNEKGDDIGLYAMGIPGGKIQEPGGILTSSKEALRPGSKQHFTWRFKPEPGYLVPGVYKLRVHQRDVTSKADVYSNTVVLTVIR
jgi:hypothetical protein